MKGTNAFSMQNMKKISSEEYSIEENAENGVDAKVSIKLKQYRAFTIGVNQINIEQKNGEIVATAQKQRQTTK